MQAFRRSTFFLQRLGWSVPGRRHTRRTKWQLEMITPNGLKRNGTTRQDFEANMGKIMNARACPAKINGNERGAAEYIKLADGILRIVGQLPERDITPEKLNF